MKLLLISVCFLFFISFCPLWGDELPDYEPYQEDEFPGWAKDLRRAEVIFFGTIPFTFLLSNLSFSLYQYASSGFDPVWAPALLGNNTPPQQTKNTKLQIIGISVSSSFILALLDYILGKPWDG